MGTPPAASSDARLAASALTPPGGGPPMPMTRLPCFSNCAISADLGRPVVLGLSAVLVSDDASGAAAALVATTGVAGLREAGAAGGPRPETDQGLASRDGVHSAGLGGGRRARARRGAPARPYLVAVNAAGVEADVGVAAGAAALAAKAAASSPVKRAMVARRARTHTSERTRARAA